MENWKTTEMYRKKYAGSNRLGVDLVDKITKEEFAAIAFYFAQRLGYEGREAQAVIEEYNTLCDNQVFGKKKFEPAPPAGAQTTE